MLKKRSLKKKKTIINLKNKISLSSDNKEEEISRIAFNLNRKLNNGLTLPEIPFPKSKYIFDIFLYIFEKPIRNQNDLLIIRHYLNNFDGFLTTLNLKKNFNNPQEILHKISFFLQMEKFDANYIICKNGDFGDKFYLIFEGSVSILIPIEYQMELTESEFIYYLKNLLKYKEYDLILKSIRSNPNIKSKFPNEIFEFERISNLKENNIHKKSENIDIDLYINRLIPKSTFGNSNDLKTFKLWKYYHVIDLDSGKQFGEIALMDDNKRRTATIITNKFTIFGTIKKEIYVSCIKFSLEMIRKSNIESILKTRLFFGYNHENFENFFFNFFKNNVIFRGDKLFKQKNKRKEIYFIKNGEIKIELYGNCKLLFEIYNNLNDDKNNSNYNNKIKKLFNLIENNYKMKSFFEENKVFNIYIINETDVIGMEDYLYNDNETYFASAKSVSSKSEYFSIELSMFQRLLKEFRIRKNYDEWIQQRRIVMTDRIFNIMENSMMHYLNFVKDKNIDNWANNFDDDKNNNNNIIKKEINQSENDDFNNNNNENVNNENVNNDINEKSKNKKNKKNHSRNFSLFFNSSGLDHTKYFNKTLTNLPKTFNPKIYYSEDNNNKENLYLTEPQTNSNTKTINFNSPPTTEKKTKSNSIFNYFPNIKKKFPINLKIALNEIKNNKYQLNFNKGHIINKKLVTNLNIYNNVVDKLIENKKNLSERNEKNLNKFDILAVDKYIENLWSERTKSKHIKNLKFKSDFYEYLNNKKNKLYIKSFGKTFYNDGKNNTYFLNNINNIKTINNEEMNEKKIKKYCHKLGKSKNHYLYVQ